MQKSCEICGSTYRTKPSHAHRRRYCSRRCFEQAHSVTMAGSGNPSWRDAKPRCVDCDTPLTHYGHYDGKPDRCNKCQRKYNRGAAHYNWQGGKTAEHAKLRNSLEYKQWRTAVFERDDYTCQECGQRGGDLHVDHIKPFAIHPELRLDVANGRTLCVPCHKKTPTYLSGTRRKSCERFATATSASPEAQGSLVLS